MSALDTLVAAHPVRGWRGLAWAIMALLAGALVWTLYARLDEVAIARGEVVPQGKVKVVQHLEGGVVQAIFVAEGREVKAGDPLLQLELAPTAMNREELQIRLDQHALDRARFEAEANGSALRLPRAESERRPELVAATRAAFEARRQELETGMTGLQEQVNQRELLVRELEATRRARVADLRLAREKFKISESLVEGNLVARIEHIQLQRDVEKLDGEIAILDQSIPRARAAVSEARERIKEERLRFRRLALEELEKAEANVARTRELLADATGQVRRAEIRSPVDGVVKNLRYNTIGGVVKPGDAIMEIVPADDDLVVEARLNPTDRGYVRIGQRAIVKISTYDYVRYGGLQGKVTHIATDANTDPQGQPYFKLIVVTDKSFLGDSAGAYPIIAGMQAEVDVHTGEKSVADYLIRPVLKLRHESFRER